MRWHWTILMAALLTPQFAAAQQYYEQPGCEAPRNCCRPSAPEAAPRRAAPEAAPRAAGAFIRSPETGEVAGESNAVGLRGLSIRLPALTLELPELRMPSLVRYRRNPEMIVEASRAPYVPGEPLEFNQVPPRVEEAAPAARPEAVPDRRVPSCDAPYYRPNCDAPLVPGASASRREKVLMDRLAEREAELAEIREQFVHLERRVAAAIDEAPAATTAAAARRQRSTGPIQLQSEDSEALSQDELSEIPEPPTTSRRKARGQAAAPVVRSQSPVVPAGGGYDDEPRATAPKATRRPAASAPHAQAKTQPKRLGGHTPFNAGSYGR